MTFGPLVFQNARRSLTFKKVLSNPALIPMHVCVVSGLSIASAYALRMLIRDPQCCIDKRDQAPWNKTGFQYQYKFLSSFDYKTLEVPPERPSID